MSDVEEAAVQEEAASVVEDVQPQEPAPTPAAKGRRPLVVSAVGGVLLMLAIFALFSVITGAVQLGNKDLRPDWITSALVGAGLSHAVITLIFLVVASVGLLTLSPWARGTTIILLIVLLLFEGVVLGMVTANAPPITGMNPAASSTWRLVPFARDLFHNLLIYGAVIYFLTRGEVKEAFKSCR